MWSISCKKQTYSSSTKQLSLSCTQMLERRKSVDLLPNNSNSDFLPAYFVTTINNQKKELFQQLGKRKSDVLLPNSRNSHFLILWDKARLNVPSYPYLIMKKTARTPKMNLYRFEEADLILPAYTTEQSAKKEKSSCVQDGEEPIFIPVFHNLS